MGEIEAFIDPVPVLERIGAQGECPIRSVEAVQRLGRHRVTLFSRQPWQGVCSFGESAEELLLFAIERYTRCLDMNCRG
jgi:hypothetical protein